jgi:hypothetical protein
MPQVMNSRVRISRRAVRVIWWGYVGGMAVLSLIVAVGAIGGRGRENEWTAPAMVCGLAGLIFAFAAQRLTGGLPQAGHRIFDTVGERFSLAIRQLFLRFALAGAAAEATAVMGALLFALGGPTSAALLLVGLGFILLSHLRRRVAPLVHYLA